MSRNFRQALNTWGAIVFGASFAITGGVSLFNYLTRSTANTNAADGSRSVPRASLQSSPDADPPSNSVQAQANSHGTAATDSAQTVAGDLVAVARANGGAATILKLSGRVVFDGAESTIGIEKTFAIEGRTVVVVSISGGGNACPATYRILSIASEGRIFTSDEFGTCSDLPKITARQSSIMITMPNMGGDGESSWTFSGETLSQIQGARPLAEATVAASGVTSPLIGEWTCRSRKGDGTSFSSAFRFAPDGAFAYADAQAQMFGMYRSSGPKAEISVDQVVNGGRTTSSKMKITAALASSSPGHLKFDMTMVRLGVVISNNCVSGAVAAVTPAPKVDICDVNPDACAAVQRNHDIRSQVQDQRCQVLRSQLSGVLGSDYQLAKAGCR